MYEVEKIQYGQQVVAFPLIEEGVCGAEPLCVCCRCGTCKEYSKVKHVVGSRGRGRTTESILVVAVWLLI